MLPTLFKSDSTIQDKNAATFVRLLRLLPEIGHSIDEVLKAYSIGNTRPCKDALRTDSADPMLKPDESPLSPPDNGSSNDFMDIDELEMHSHESTGASSASVDDSSCIDQVIMPDESDDGQTLNVKQPSPDLANRSDPEDFQDIDTLDLGLNTYEETSDLVQPRSDCTNEGYHDDFQDIDALDLESNPSKDDWADHPGGQPNIRFFGPLRPRGMVPATHGGRENPAILEGDDALYLQLLKECEENGFYDDTIE